MITCLSFRTALFICSMFTSHCEVMQTRYPVDWTYSYETIKGKNKKLLMTAVIKPGWHIYSSKMQEGGPLPSRFIFETDKSWISKSKVDEVGKPVLYYDSSFMIPVAWFEESVTFVKMIRLREKSALVKGTIEYMACKDGVCLPPEEKKFSIEVHQ